MSKPGDSKPASQLEAEREMQRRDAARGCLLILILQGAALLGGVLWVIGLLFDLRAIRSAGGFGFIAFTIAAAATAGIVLVLSNTPRHRRRRRRLAAQEADNSNETD